MKASCTWGDGPDILLSLEGKILILMEKPKRTHPPQGSYQHGYVTKGQIDLTANEAINLAQSLMETAIAAITLNNLTHEVDPSH